MDLFDEAADFRDREAQEAYNRMMRRLDEVEVGLVTSGGFTIRAPVISGDNYESCPNCGAKPMWRETETIGGHLTGRAVCARCKQ